MEVASFVVAVVTGLATIAALVFAAYQVLALRRQLEAQAAEQRERSVAKLSSLVTSKAAANWTVRVINASRAFAWHIYAAVGDADQNMADAVGFGALGPGQHAEHALSVAGLGESADLGVWIIWKDPSSPEEARYYFSEGDDEPPARTDARTRLSP